mgnify:CR=1 FL=1
MKNSLKNDIGLALLRVVPSVLMITHGYPKLQNLLSGEISFGDPIGIGAAPSLFLTVLAELICPVLVIIGFKTRWAAVPTAITMAVAAFIVHGSDALAKKEMALLYLTFFVAIIILGPGRYSADKG